MELVQQAMADRGEQDACRDQHDQATVKRVEAREEFATEGQGRVHGTHAAQKHGCIEESINPIEPFQKTIPTHTSEQRKCDGREGEHAAVTEAKQKVGGGQQGLSMVLELGKQLFHGKAA
jgi:hypothetical protein